MRRNAWVIVGIALLAAWLWWQQSPSPALPEAGNTPPPVSLPESTPRPPRPDARQDPGTATIPREAFDTLALIERDGAFPHRQDGATFQNRERLLPQRQRGWYREYTVRTPGERSRGARRIVTGGNVSGNTRPSEYYYTSDHYRSFRRFDPATGQLQGGRLQ